MLISTASGQKCLFCGETFPLYPPIVSGCPACAHTHFKAPLELIFDYPRAADWLSGIPIKGLESYSPVLPPIQEGLSMGEGGTPLIHYPHKFSESDVELFIKDESQNPTWSHKDRLNLIVTSAAIHVKARGVVAASSGNHGASAAAYAARGGLPAVIITTPRPPTISSFLQAYGQIVVAVPDIETRWLLTQRLVDELDYHPTSNLTSPPTNHPFGAEGYKTISYELYLQLGHRIPEAIFVPVGFGELLFGIYKGFSELMTFGLINEVPKLIACESASGAPLKLAYETNQPIISVVTGQTDAYSIAVSTNGYRGIVALRKTNGAVLALTDSEIYHAQKLLSKAGIWGELSAAISIAGALHYSELGLSKKGPIVCISTSSGFKDIRVGEEKIHEIDGSWEALLGILKQNGLE